MLVLIFFALIAGAGTAITPCVLPVLPAVLSASAVGGRRRPVGIILGLTITFAVSIIALSSISKGAGLGDGLTRTISWIILIAAGVVLLVPPVAERIQAPLSRLARFGPKSQGDGFTSGIGVGAALGFVCAPCGSPIAAAVIAAGNSGHTNGSAVEVGIAYAIGLGAVLLLYALGGQRAAGAIRKRLGGHTVERAMGVVLILTGVVIAFNLDNKVRNIVAGHTGSGLLAFFNDPTSGLETSNAVQHRLTSIRPTSKLAARQAASHVAPPKPRYGISLAGVKTPSLPNLGPAPNFTGTEDWWNTPGDKPLTIAGLRGRVVLIDFWTYTCINCIRTLPFVEGLYKNYAKYGLTVVGIEAPEFEFEKEAANVQQAIHQFGLTYPIVQDNNLATWNAYQNEYWPAEYLIDAGGNVRHTQFGEGSYQEDEAAVRELLYDAGSHTLPPPMTAHALMPSTNLGTPETYLDPQRAQGFLQPVQAGTHSYAGGTLGLNQFALKGSWTAGSESVMPAASGAEIDGGVQAQHVYLVMTSTGGVPRTGRVLLNGKPIPAKFAGSDVRAGGYFTVSGQRLYNLISFPQDAQTEFSVQLPQGISAYDFTFG